MTPIRWSSRASADLQAIQDFIAQDSPHHAGEVACRIIKGADSLPDSPRLGRVVPEQRDPLVRELIIGAYRLVYRIEENAIEVMTVFHGARRFRRESR